MQMTTTELIEALDTLAGDAAKVDALELANFWTSASAWVARQTLGIQLPLSKKEAGLHDLAPDVFQIQVKKVLESASPDDRVKAFEAMRSTLNDYQRRGGITLAKADILRKITNEIEDELALED